MDPILLSVQEYIKSGEYFKDARKWYLLKYLAPIPQRSLLLVVCLLFVTLSVGIGINLESLFPLVTPVRYSIRSNDALSKVATILRADQIKNNALGSITDILAQGYVLRRESYDYDLLKSQFNYIQNNSTRLVFRKFYNFMGIDNAQSPIMLYQKYTRRSVNITSTKYNSNNEAIITFNSIAKSIGGEIMENRVWQATISFEIDKINMDLPPDAKFNFAVTGYRLKLLQDKLSK